MKAVKARYLAYRAEIDDPDAGLKDFDKLSSPVKDDQRSFRRFNLLLEQDYQLFLTLARDEWSISGFRASDLRACMPSLSSHSVVFSA
jgi:hypothetical protein